MLNLEFSLRMVIHLSCLVRGLFINIYSVTPPMWDTNIPNKKVSMLWHEFKTNKCTGNMFLLEPRIYKNAHPGYLGLEENKGTKTSQRSDTMIEH